MVTQMFAKECIFIFIYWFKIKNNFWAEDSYENDRKVMFIYSNALQIQMTYKSTVANSNDLIKTANYIVLQLWEK